jgi:hypothetical protein
LRLHRDERLGKSLSGSLFGFAVGSVASDGEFVERLGFCARQQKRCLPTAALRCRRACPRSTRSRGFLAWATAFNEVPPFGLQGQDFDKAAATEPKTQAGKRAVYLPAEVVEYLDLIHSASRFPGAASLIFSSNVGTPLTHRNVTKRGWSPPGSRA